MKKQFLLSFVVAIAFLFNAPVLFSQDWHLAGNSDASSASKLGTTNNTPVRVFTNNIERMRFDPTGKVGLGTTSPTGKLTIQNNGSVPAGSWVTAVSPILVGLGEASGGYGDFIIGMAANTGTTRPVFMGRRGRGTLASPAKVSPNDFLLSILASGYDGSSFQNPATIDFYVDGTPTSGNVPARISMVTGTNISNRKERLKILYDGNIAFNENQLFVNNSTGNVGVGTIAPIKKVHIENGDLRIQGTSGAPRFFEFIKPGAPVDWRLEHGSAGTHFYLSFSTNDFSSFSDKAFFSNSATGSGNSFTHYGDAIGYKWNIFSDEKLKSNIADLTSASSIISSLKPKTYYYKQSENTQLQLSSDKQYGLIAQDLEKVLPELVSTTTMPVKIVNNERQMEEVKGINYIGLIPLLIRSIQEQQQQIDELKVMVKKLSEKETASVNSSTSLLLSNISLSQNVPNPFTSQTNIRYNIPQGFQSARMVITDYSGKIIKQIPLSVTGEGTIKLNATALKSGTFTYSIVADGKTYESKKMIVAK